VFARPYESVTEMEDFQPPHYHKTPEQMEKLTSILKKSFLTKNLTNFEIKIIADAMYQKQYVKGDFIIRYGDMGSEYYVLEKGNVEVIVYKEGTEPSDP
jgi:signal-transduction protein with cAMP-binding, CBS, and nucleotidyltransferase domain